MPGSNRFFLDRRRTRRMLPTRLALAIATLELWACGAPQMFEAAPGREPVAAKRRPQPSAAEPDEPDNPDRDGTDADSEQERQPAREAGQAGRAPAMERDTPAGTDSNREGGSSGAQEKPPTEPAQPGGAQTPVRPSPATEEPERVVLTETRVLAPFAGRMATPAPGQAEIGLYGTDLGFSFVHRGAIHFLFGDSWADARGNAVGLFSDDIQGTVSLADFPDGRAVEAYVRAHPAAEGALRWQASAPPLEFLLDAEGGIASIRVMRGDEELDMGLGRTPTAGFSDGEDVFAFFHRWVPVPCDDEDGTPSCDHGYTCDTGLGTFLAVTGDYGVPCVVGEPGCSAAAGGGLCQDRTSSVYRDSPSGRIQSIVLEDAFGNLDRTRPGHYLTRSFQVQKFRNPAVRTVADFDPSRRDGEGNVYTSVTESRGERSKVFVWGRPAFGAPTAQGSNAALYFMYMDMPGYSETGDVEMSMHYFTGLRDGVPQFSNSSTEARPLDLSFPGPDPMRERWDVVNQMSISWIESLGKWVMLYGGDMAERSIPLIVGPDATLEPDPEQAIHVRFADQPWGPWTAPERAFKASDSSILYAEGCEGRDCPPPEPVFGEAEPGKLYGANIIEPWTHANEDGTVDLYWTVSTWVPYQVVLLTSRLEPD